MHNNPTDRACAWYASQCDLECDPAKPLPSFLQMTVGQCLRVILTMAVVSLLFASPIFLNTHFHIPILDTDTTAAAAADYESQGKPHLRVGTFTDKVPCVSSEQSRSAQSSPDPLRA